MVRERSRKLLFRACFFFMLFMPILFSCYLCSETDTLSTNQSLVQGQTLVSKQRKFEVGLFSPGSSSNWYLGIWYKGIPTPTVVWVANRNNPIRSPSSEVRISGGYLVINDNSSRVWISNVSNVTEATILDSGNFVLRNASGIIWESFDHPTDTWLPGASIGFRSLETKLVSWKDTDDPSTGKGKVTLPLVIILPIIASTIVAALCICYFRRKSGNKASSIAYRDLLLLDLKSNEQPNRKAQNQYEYDKNKYELPIFSFASIVMATNNFDAANILGEGGFGPVYKGELLNGQFVAIKRLSRRSGQGLEEFKTEMELIAKLQHRNLVGILGCCIENDEMILIYEYMQNKSLDFFLFDSTRKASLDWTRRVQIIEGVAQGLLYLHHYSRLRIVHRDLKASNILLDDEMTPKISDFGMARIFGGNSSSANTKRIVGTFGYMSPEYAMHGLFSVKSDIFAFGVLVLEIISGKKNTSFYNSDHLSLLRYAWYLWENDRVLELIDPVLEIFASSANSIPMRYIQIGLLCVQENATDRPMISDVVRMLSNDQKELARPKMVAVGRSMSDGRVCSVNGLTISSMEEGR